MIYEIKMSFESFNDTNIQQLDRVDYIDIGIDVIPNDKPVGILQMFLRRRRSLPAVQSD